MSDEKQPRDATIQNYRARIDRVLAHIERAVAEGGRDVDLDLDTLADIACFSRFHFHRIYRAIARETPSQTIRRLRLHRAATALLQSDRPVSDIAREAGYGTVEAFTRAFAAAYSAAPGVYRAEAEKEELTVENVTIREEPAYRLAAMAHRGPYHEIGSAFERLSVWARGAGLLGPQARMIGVYYDDPQSVAAAELRSDAGVTAPADFTPSDPVHLVELAGGVTAVYRHVGPYAELAQSWQRFYAGWLPTSGREPADKPPYDIYLNDPMVTPPAELITEICIPLKPA